MRVQAGKVSMHSLRRTKRQFTEEYIKPMARAAADYAENVIASDLPYIDRSNSDFDWQSRRWIDRAEYVLSSGRTLRMLRDQVLIRLLHPERMTASKLLWIPDNAQRPESELYQGLVLAVGPGKDYGHGRLLPDVRPGDKCVFYWGAGEIAVDRLYDDSEELRILAEGSIQGIWRQ